MLVTTEVLMLRLTVFAFSAIAFGQGLKFEVASIKPADPNATGGQLQFMPGGGIRARNFPLKNLITLAYDVRDFQLSDGPGWLATERYDIVAKADRTASDGPEDFGNMTEEQRKTAREQIGERLRNLLSERFQLAVHRQTKEQSIYSLEIAKSGTKLQDSRESDRNQSMSVGRGRIEGHVVPVQMLAQTLSGLLARAVTDKTGLTGKYDFVLQWTPDVGTGGAPNGPEADKSREDGLLNGPTLFSAIQEELGLRLESQKGPVETVVIDHIERPSNN